MKTFAVTGANGYLGGHICQFLTERHFEVLSLKRVSCENETTEKSVYFSLKNTPKPDIFKKTEVLIHCAYDPTPVTWKEINEVNVEGSIRLFQAAQAGGIKKIIYISSMSAFENCKSLYGQAKLAIEKEVLKMGEQGVIIRPGLIFGGQLGGFLAAIKSLATRLPLVPLIGKGDQTLYFSHIDDLCKLIFTLHSKSNLVPGPITAASENGKAFKEIVKTLAQQEKNFPILVPMPWKIAWFGLKVLELSGVRIGFRSDSVLGLVFFNSHPDFNPLKKIGLPFKNFG